MSQNKWWVQCNLIKPIIDRQIKKRYHPEEAARDRRNDLLQHMYECGKHWDKSYRLYVLFSGRKFVIKVGENYRIIDRADVGLEIAIAIRNHFWHSIDVSSYMWFRRHLFEAYDEWRSLYDTFVQYIRHSINRDLDGPLNIERFMTYHDERVKAEEVIRRREEVIRQEQEEVIRQKQEVKNAHKQKLGAVFNEYKEREAGKIPQPYATIEGREDYPVASATTDLITPNQLEAAGDENPSNKYVIPEAIALGGKTRRRKNKKLNKSKNVKKIKSRKTRKRKKYRK